MDKWISPRLEASGKTTHNFRETLAFDAKTFKRWDAAELKRITVEKRIKEITTFFDCAETEEELLQEYIRVQNANIPDHLKYFISSIEALEHYPNFLKMLTAKQKVSGLIPLARKTEESIKKNNAKKATRIMIRNFSDAIDSLIKDIVNEDDLQKVNNLIACFALVAANKHPIFAEKSFISIKIESNSEDEDIAVHEKFAIQMMIDRNRASPLVECLIMPNKDRLLASGHINLLVTNLGDNPKSDTLKGRLKEVHGWVESIARKHACDPELVIPNLAENDYQNYQESQFWLYRKELQRKIFSVNDTKNHIFATVREGVPTELVDLVLAYFTEDIDEGDKADPETALKLYRLSTQEGYKPYRLDVGVFSYWIINRLKNLEEQRKRLNSKPNKLVPKAGDENMNQKEFTTGDLKIAKVEYLAIGGKQDNRQDNRQVNIHEYKNKLTQLQELIGSDTQAEQALQKKIQELLAADPKTIGEKHHKQLWTDVKKGITKLNDSTKTVKAFNKAYTTACDVYQYLFF